MFPGVQGELSEAEKDEVVRALTAADASLAHAGYTGGHAGSGIQAGSVIQTPPVHYLLGAAQQGCCYHCIRCHNSCFAFRFLLCRSWALQPLPLRLCLCDWRWAFSGQAGKRTSRRGWVGYGWGMMQGQLHLLQCSCVPVPYTCTHTRCGDAACACSLARSMAGPAQSADSSVTVSTHAECGGAVQTARCPACGSTIGGTQHSLAEGNAPATDFFQRAQGLHR